MDLLVVGAGAMGRWFAASVDADVAFADRDPAVAREAAETVGGRAVALDGDERFAVVCLAVPMDAIESAVAANAPRAREALVDVTGVMGPAVGAMREHAPDRQRASFHPLFAPENAPGTVAVVVDADGPHVVAIREALVAGGNEVFETTAADHDRAMETVQARAHAAVLAFALAAEDVPEAFHTPLSGPLADLVDQLTGNAPRVYADIQATFDGAEAVADAAARIADADRETFERLYREASERAAGRAGGDADAPGSAARPSNAPETDDAATGDSGLDDPDHDVR